jgi:autotransporter-associated beta strand protein
LASANTYRGSTTINNGILEIRNPLALGTADGTVATGTIVNQSTGKVGTLQINDPTRQGFTVANELLTLNSLGVNGGGSLSNVGGDNVWAGDVVLGSPAPNGSLVGIGVNEGTSLTVTGIVQERLNARYGLLVNPTPGGFTTSNQPDNGTLIFTRANTYTGGFFGTEIHAGVLQIQDSRGMGGSICSVDSGATLALAIDDLPDSVTGTTNTLVVSNTLNLAGTGFGGLGALLSRSGINTYAGLINLQGSVSSIGVSPDPNPTSSTDYFPTFDASGDAISGDFSLTVLGGIGRLNGGRDTTLEKLGDGQLILPRANGDTGGNGLTSNVEIAQGWVTIQDSHSLGATFSDRDQNLQPQTKVESGAALHLLPAAGSLDLGQNLVLAGQGISHPFGLINQAGALENLTANNTVHGNITLQGQVGIGVEKVFGGPGAPSQLLSTGSVSERKPVLNLSATASGGSQENDNISDTGSTSGVVTVNYQMYSIPDQLEIYYGVFGQGGKLIASTGGLVSGTGTLSAVYGPGNTSIIEIIVDRGGGLPGTAWTYTGSITPTEVRAGGITKLGSQMLILQGDGTYTGPVDIRQGVLLNQNNTGLGTGTGTTTVEAGASLALASTVASLNGGVQTGLQVWGEHLVLNGPGNDTLGTHLAPLAILDDNSVTGPTPGPIIPTDSMWRGPVTLNPGVSIQVPTNNRLIFTGTVSDSSTSGPGGADLNKVGGGELVLTAANTYRGTTYVGAGPNGDPLVPEVQQVEAYGTAGTFALTFNGQTTAPLNLGATAAAVQAALNALPLTFGGVTGSVSVTQTGSFYTVVFGGGLYGVNVPQLTIGGTTGGTLAVATTLTDGSTLSTFFASPGALAGGVLTVANNQALGATTAGTVVENGSSIQLEGNTTIAGESLTISGSGLAVAPTTPPQTWFDQGPGPVTSSQTLGNPAVASGRITGVAPDPTDPQTIYISTAGGGAWKTSNGGQTWLPLFDQGPNGGSIFTGAIAVDPSNPLHVYLGTGEANNSGDSYSGNGVYESTDGGRTWALLTGETQWSVNPPIRIPDPTDTNTPKRVKGVNRGTLGFTAGVNPFNGLAISAISVANGGTIFVSTSDEAVNGRVASGNAGVWRYDPGSGWFDMTNMASDLRMGFGTDTTQGGSGFPNNQGPGTPGPDDEWNFAFPSNNAVYSDVKYAGTLFMALGTPGGDSGAAINAVYHCDNSFSYLPVWYIGDENGTSHKAYDTGGGSVYRSGLQGTPNGNIKLTTTDGFTIYAVDTDPFTQGLRDIQISTDGGRTWADIGAPPGPDPDPRRRPDQLHGQPGPIRLRDPLGR